MREVNLTRGPIMGRLVRFSLPMIAGNMLQQVYNLVDTLVVGRGIGANALAAVGSAYTLMTFLTSILIGLCMGSGAFFSEDYGAGDTAQLRQDMLLSFWFIFWSLRADLWGDIPGHESHFAPAANAGRADGAYAGVCARGVCGDFLCVPV